MSGAQTKKQITQARDYNELLNKQDIEKSEIKRF